MAFPLFLSSDLVVASRCAPDRGSSHELCTSVHEQRVLHRPVRLGTALSVWLGSVGRGGDVQMTAQRAERSEAVEQGSSANEVRLVGRLAADPRLRELPSGDTVWNLRVMVERPSSGTEKPRQRVDSLECTVWGGRLKKQVEGWFAGDLVDVSGALRRRFFRAGGVTASRVEVELRRGKVIRRVGIG